MTEKKEAHVDREFTQGFMQDGQDFNESKIKWGKAGSRCCGHSPQKSVQYLIPCSSSITLGLQPCRVFEDKLCKTDKGVLGPTSHQPARCQFILSLMQHPFQSLLSVPTSTEALEVKGVKGMAPILTVLWVTMPCLWSEPNAPLSLCGTHLPEPLLFLLVTYLTNLYWAPAVC